MFSILEPTELLRQIEKYAQDEIDKKNLPKGSYELLREALLSGEFERGKASSITGSAERTARDVLSALTRSELLESDSPKSAVRLGFPLEVVERWFPLLYPVTLKTI